MAASSIRLLYGSAAHRQSKLRFWKGRNDPAGQRHRDLILLIFERG
ncbi:MAG: hypothetical protein NO482_06780 [Candidatus Methanomethylicia archaeon]|nr:hypothetical protein [Candidatus Methanomethylicia archaeon]